MKKFRIVAILLVMCLASSCFVGSTFARYSSTASASDSAVVAKWKIDYTPTPDGNLKDLTTEPITFNLFNTINDTDGQVENSVATDKIAPGTKGSFQFVLSNTSDVDAQLDVDIVETIENDSTGLLVSPIEYTVVLSGNDASAVKTDTIGQDCVSDATFNRGDSITVTVNWVWTIDGNNSDNAWGEEAQNNILDIKIAATINVTQVD